MNFENIQCFLTLAETLNFTKAAELEHITQTSMSRKIHALESEMGVILFFRDNKRVSLTPAGEEFYRQSVFLYKQYHRLLQQVKNANLGARKEIHIGVGLYEHILLDAYLPHFVRQFPEVKISCLQFQYLPLIKQLEHEYLDIILTSDQFFNQVHMEEYDCILIYDRPWKVAVSAKGELAKKRKLQREDFFQQTLITMFESSVEEIKDFYRKWVKVQDCIYANSYDTKMAMIQSGLGLGFVPAFVPEDQNGQILLKEMEEPVVFRKFYAMAKRENSNVYINEWMANIREEVKVSSLDENMGK